jgi:lysophospholipase L1-like esterase
VRGIRFWLATKTDLASLHFSVWRKDGATYDRVGRSENIVPNATAGQINEISFTAPIAGVEEGDYIGYDMTTTGVVLCLYATGDSEGETYYYDGVASDANFDWEAQPNSATIVRVKVLMDDPHMVGIGDSIMQGATAHGTYVQNARTDNAPGTTILGHLADNISGLLYQNMGIGSETSTQIEARFANDVVGLSPKYALIEAGRVDISGGGISKATFLANQTSMLDACVAAGIIPIILQMTSWTNGTNVQMQTRDEWNGDMVTLVASYPRAILVDSEDRVGMFRVGGDPGNLWDIQTSPDYDDDGSHFTSLGHEQIALEIADNID